MHTYSDGSVVLKPEEVAVVAKALSLGRELAEMMDDGDGRGAVEAHLIDILDELCEMGISPKDLTEKLDPRLKAR